MPSKIVETVSFCLTNRYMNNDKRKQTNVRLDNRRGHSHLGFEVLRGVVRGFINKRFKVRRVPIHRGKLIALLFCTHLVEICNIN